MSISPLTYLVKKANCLIASSGYFYYSYIFFVSLFPKSSPTFSAHQEANSPLLDRVDLLGRELGLDPSSIALYIQEGREDLCVGYSGFFRLTHPILIVSKHFENSNSIEKNRLLARELSHIKHFDSIKRSAMILTASLIYTLYLSYFLSQVLYFAGLATLGSMYFSTKIVEICYTPLQKRAEIEAMRLR